MKTAKLPTKIDRFWDVHRFLSNFYPATVKVWVATDGQTFADYAKLSAYLEDHSEEEVFLHWIEEYESVEHAFQALKSLDLEVREKFRIKGVTPGIAKRMGRALKKIRPDWDVESGKNPPMKVVFMLDLLMQKFAPSIMKRRLLSTFQATLIEGNNWHDVFWGVCDGTCDQGPHEPFGENHLGQLLQIVRGIYGGTHVPETAEPR